MGILEIIIILLVVLWLLGLLGGIGGNFIYILLVVALALVIIRLAQGRRVL